MIETLSRAMAAVAMDTLIFKESPRGPWGPEGRPSSSAGAGGRRKLDPLPDAFPPALKSIFQK